MEKLWKKVEIVQNQTFIEKMMTKKCQTTTKLTFNGIHSSHTKYDNHILRQNEVLMYKPINLGFAVIELCKLLMYETYYDKLQQYFRGKNFQLLHMDTGSFVMSINSTNNIRDKRNFEEVCHFSNLKKKS